MERSGFYNRGGVVRDCRGGGHFAGPGFCEIGIRAREFDCWSTVRTPAGILLAGWLEKNIAPNKNIWKLNYTVKWQLGRFSVKN